MLINMLMSMQFTATMSSLTDTVLCAQVTHPYILYYSHYLSTTRCCLYCRRCCTSSSGFFSPLFAVCFALLTLIDSNVFHDTQIFQFDFFKLTLNTVWWPKCLYGSWVLLTARDNCKKNKYREQVKYQTGICTFSATPQ